MIKKISSTALYFRLSIVLVFILFHRTIESLFSAAVVRPILSQVESTTINDLAILLLGLLFLIVSFSKFKKRNLVNLNLLTTLLILSLGYSWYRFNTEVWEFVPMHNLKSVKYLDVLYLPLLFYSLAFATNYLPKQSHGQSPKFVEDNPLSDSSQDIFNYDHYCSSIANKINESVFNTSFAIGVNGVWGTGKTSFMRLIELHLSRKNQTIIHFNPWSSRSAEGITIDFFNALRKNFSFYHSDISNKLTEYANNLIANSNNSLINAFNVFKKSDSLTEQYESIDNILKKLSHQTVIFIDDLDRLDEFEAQEVIKF